MKMTAFWDIAPCSLVEVDRHFRGAYCLHHQGDLMIEAVSSFYFKYVLTAAPSCVFMILH
jgi:hypothetical protein